MIRNKRWSYKETVDFIYDDEGYLSISLLIGVTDECDSSFCDHNYRRFTNNWKQQIKKNF